MGGTGPCFTVSPSSSSLHRSADPGRDVLVTSHDAGLSGARLADELRLEHVHLPASGCWVANILYEHGHRLIASTVGFLTIVLAVWLWMTESRTWLPCSGSPRSAPSSRRVLLGTTHGFCFSAASRIDRACGAVRNLLRHGRRDRGVHVARVERRIRPERRNPPAARHDERPFHLLSDSRWRDHCGTTAAGLAIPIFPLMFGHLVPDHWDPKIAGPLRRIGSAP